VRDSASLDARVGLPPPARDVAPALPTRALNALAHRGHPGQERILATPPLSHRLGILPRRYSANLRPFAMLCGEASVNSVTLCHPPPYGRRDTSSKEDGGTLEKGTGTCPTPTRDDADSRLAECVSSITSDPVWPSPRVVQPSRTLCGHPRHRGNPERQDVATPVAVHPTAFRQPHPRVSVRTTTEWKVPT
jgi:hypothetical protein